jgi:hypothetical protein
MGCAKRPRVLERFVEAGIDVSKEVQRKVSGTIKKWKKLKVERPECIFRMF